VPLRQPRARTPGSSGNDVSLTLSGFTACPISPLRAYSARVTIGGDRMQLLEVFFQPPMAVARLGGSDTPLESFRWREDPSLHGAGKTVLEPATTLEIQLDGTPRPYLPSGIRFRDQGLIRPVAPFFELWARVKDGGNGKEHVQPLSLPLLQQLGASLDALSFTLEVANLKAARRCGDPACGYVARVTVPATDHRRHALLARSPQQAGTQPLVTSDRPIPLGHFQVLRPVPALELGVDLGVVRVRFTPAKGEVYGPPAATAAPSPDLQRIHTLVKPENRILNPAAAWCAYDANDARYDNPQPSDTYDGADALESERSWGVVDDTCDGTLRASVVVRGVRFEAFGRVFAGPPDFAPDRRPFVSLADDLADRDVVEPAPYEAKVSEAEISDLFQRAFETVSLLNLDAQRQRGLSENAANGLTDDVPGYPHADGRSMTAQDVPYADKTRDLLTQPTPQNPVPYAEVASDVHEPLADIEVLMDFLRDYADRVHLLIRPPYALFRELADDPDQTPRTRRDPRRTRDGVHDMRMPPFMRDSDASPLSLTRRQYAQLMDLVDRLKAGMPAGVVADVMRAARPAAPNTPAREHVHRVLSRRRQKPEQP